MKGWHKAVQWVLAGVMAVMPPAVAAGQKDMWRNPAGGQAAVAPFAVYEADIVVKPDEHRVTGSLTARFVPPDPERVYFHLYPNAFREEARLNDPNWEYVLGREREAGGIKVQRVDVQGRSVPFRVQDTLLEVPLGDEVKAGRRAEVKIRFDLRVPRNNGRFSYNEHAMWLGNWLPILAVHEPAGWRLDPYYPMGDPFYSETADYRVRVRLPAGYQLVTSGIDSQARVRTGLMEPEPAQVQSGRLYTEYRITANAIRDFAMVVMDQTYRAKVSRSGDVLVRTWHQTGDSTEQAGRMHDVAHASIGWFSRTFGSYAWQEYDVVKTGGFFGGMEYPGIVFIQGDFFREAVPEGEVAVAHETAHQWFYGLVGNDEVREAWVDESLTDYATMAFLQAYDPKVAREYVERRSRRAVLASRYAEQGLHAWVGLDKFPDWRTYSDLVYSRGAVMLWELRQAWGEEAVHQVLREYVASHRFALASGVDVVEAFSRAAGADAGPFFDYWLKLDETRKQAAEAWLEAGKKRIVGSKGE